MQEVSPDTVVLKTMSGNITAQRVIDDLMKDGKTEGILFISDLLRVSRDMMMREANHNKKQEKK